jgi:hypothetical protein
MKTDVDQDRTTTRSGFGNDSHSGTSGISQEEMMKRVEAAGTPGPGHKALQALVGDWKAEVKCWMDPSGAPEVSEGTAKASFTFNGRFLQEDFHGQMMGKPFTGRTLMGFDNTKQTFNSVWVSDTQTSMFTSEGKGENGNKVITMEGKATCPATGRKDIPMKTVLRVINPDKHVLEMFDGSKGVNAKTMEITYSRR